MVYYDSTKESTDTMPVIQKRDVPVCSSCKSWCKSLISEESIEMILKPAGSRARTVRDSIAAALRIKPPSSLPPAFSKVALKKPLRKSLPAIAESPNPKRRPTVASPHGGIKSLTRTKPSERSASYDTKLKVPERKPFSSGIERDAEPKKPFSSDMQGGSGHTTCTEATARMSGSSCSSVDTPNGRKSKRARNCPNKASLMTKRLPKWPRITHHPSHPLVSLRHQRPK
jgi:hypothetical protein